MLNSLCIACLFPAPLVIVRMKRFMAKQRSRFGSFGVHVPSDMLNLIIFWVARTKKIYFTKLYALNPNKIYHQL